MSDPAELAEGLQEVRRCETARDVDALIALLSDWREGGRRVTVRGAAARALGRIGDRGAAPDVVVLLQDRSAFVRFAAADVLGQLGKPDSCGALVLALADSVPLVRMTAAKSLGELNENESAAALVAALHDPDPWVSLHAAEAFVALGEPPERLIATQQALRQEGRQ